MSHEHEEISSMAPEIASTIADMDLDPAAEAEVIEAFTGAGLLWMIGSRPTSDLVAEAEALHRRE